MRAKFLVLSWFSRDHGERNAIMKELGNGVKMGKEYRKVSQALDQLLVEQDGVEKEKLARNLREVLGAVIVLANSLYLVSLASPLIR
jgi:hypothetical protein